MRSHPAPLFDPRTAGQVLRELLARRPGYAPEWRPQEGGPSWALLHIYARLVQIVIERLNRAPDKNLLAFLDMLGIDAIPAQAARAPVVFKTLENTDGFAPAGTRLGAAAADQAGGSLAFETERSIALAGAKLVEVVSLLPDGSYADHSAAMAKGLPQSLFQAQQPVPQMLYLAHDILLDLEGEAQVELSIDLRSASTQRLSIAWEYWDGQVWRPFKVISDGSDGLTRSGLVIVQLAGGRVEKTAVNGIDAHWMRARLTAPLPVLTGPALPEIERIRMRSVIARDQEAAVNKAFANGGRVDLTRAFLPLGRAPRLGDVFYFTSAAFAKPNAQIAARFQLAQTPEVEADDRSQEYGVNVNEARREWIQMLLTLGNEVIEASVSMSTISDKLSSGGFWSDPFRIARTNLQAVLDTLATDPSGSTLAEHYTTIRKLATALAEELVDYADMSPLPPTIPDNPAILLGADSSDPGAVAGRAQGAMDAMTTLGQFTVLEAAVPGGAPPPEMSPPQLAWEFWNGSRWQSLPVTATPAADVANFLAAGTVSFPIPETLKPCEVSGRKAPWVRVRLAAGSYYNLRVISWFDPETCEVNFIPVLEPRPPQIDQFSLTYRYDSSPSASASHYPARCLTWNDFTFTEHRDTVRWTGSTLSPFQPIAERTPAIYLGFDRPLPRGQISLYADVDEVEGVQPAPLAWESWDGSRWQMLSVRDDTWHLTRSGMITFEALPMAYLARFGAKRAWIRARLKDEGDPPPLNIKTIHLNAVWARQQQTDRDEVMGSSTGLPGQVFFFRRTPVLVGEWIEVRELSGRRAEVEHSLLRDELLQGGFKPGDIRTVANPRDGRVTEVWVRWQPRPHLYFSGPDDRHYLVDRVRGRLLFGNGVQGKIPPAGDNNILARRYQSGGGKAGNVAAEAITQLLTMTPGAQGVSNPRPAEGGADSEDLSVTRLRGPEDIRHRWRALSALDYAALAREASPAVAVARALPATRADGRAAPGWVTVQIVPHSSLPEPQPSPELKRQVHAYLAARAPAGMCGIQVAGPDYWPVDVTVTVVAKSPGDAEMVERRVREALARFLHPLTGGPEGTGWPFGRDLYQSDLAAVVEGVAGVDYMEGLQLAQKGSPRGEHISVPGHCMVSAGTVEVRMRWPEARRG